MNRRNLHHKGIMICHIVIVAGLTTFISKVEQHNCSLVVVKAFFALGVLVICTSSPPYSLSSECADSFPSEWSSLNSGILAFPLSNHGLSRDVL